jgi:hypothetical protein
MKDEKTYWTQKGNTVIQITEKEAKKLKAKGKKIYTKKEVLKIMSEGF